MIFLLAFMMFPVYAIMRGAVFLALWNWFVIEAFPAAPDLSFALAVGLAFFVTFIVFSWEPDTKEEKKYKADHAPERVIDTMVFSFVFYPSVLLIGFVIHLFV